MQRPDPSGVALRQSPASDAVSATAGPAVPAHSANVAKILLTDAEAAALFSVGLRTFAKLQSEPWFPRPVALGARLKRHNRAELEAAVAHMPRPDRPGEPAQLLRGKVERLKRSGCVS